MKLVVIFKNKLTSQYLLPRDVRNIFGSLTKDMQEINKLVMWHERKQPPFIYTLPTKGGFSVVTYLETIEAKTALEYIRDKLQKTMLLPLSGTDIEISKVYIAKHNYTNFSSGLYERKLQTPMILGVSVGEYARARELSKDGKVDIEELSKFASDTINESIRFQNKDWFGKEDYEIDNLMLIYKDLEYTVIKFKNNMFYPAIRATIVSNKNLPDFLGYKCGMGYGELRRAGRN